MSGASRDKKYEGRHAAAPARGASGAWARHTWPRPALLALYMALSARLTIASGESPSGNPNAMPMLAPIRTLAVPSSIGCSISAMMALAICSALDGLTMPTSAMTNSSPPGRAIRSPRRALRSRIRAT